MTDASITEIGMQAMILTAKLSAPILLTTLIIGLLIGMVQSATQLQEPTIAFVPKFIALAVVMLICGNWMLSESISFVHQLFDQIPKMLS